MVLEKSLMSGCEGKGSMDGSFLWRGETLVSDGGEKLVFLGIDGNIGGSGVLEVIGGKCDL